LVPKKPGEGQLTHKPDKARVLRSKDAEAVQDTTLYGLDWGLEVIKGSDASIHFFAVFNAYL
jgi:hypothetical protein